VPQVFTQWINSSLENPVRLGMLLNEPDRSCEIEHVRVGK